MMQVSDDLASTVREHVVDLVDRGRVHVWEWPGSANAPVLVLLHGAGLDAEVNWFPVGPALSRHFRVITLDMPGHGRGLPATSPYRLEDCADDVAAVLRALDTGPVVAVGYSMGGMVAQLFWHRHADLTAGLVLCATARNAAGTLWEQMFSLGMPMAMRTARWMPPLFLAGADSIAGPLLDAQMDPGARRTTLAHMRRTPLAVVLEAMHAVSRFTSHQWIGTVDVPTAVVVTRHDRIVAPRRQHKLADAVPGSIVVEVDGDHGIFLADTDEFTDGLLEACTAVTGAKPPTATTAA